MRRWRWILALTLGALPASAEQTSCDLVAGASCVWGEGCDCDQDGYVREKLKGQKYCNLEACPIDSDDNDPTKLGKPSKYNADGDGWTTKYDCDDQDPCVGQVCGVDTCKPKPDADKDGYDAGADCDDQDPNVHPGATLVCCNCEVLSRPELVKFYGCAAGCPLSAQVADAGSTADAAADGGGPDVGPGDAGALDAGSTAEVAADGSGPDAGAADAGSLDSGAESPDSDLQDAADLDANPSDAGIGLPETGDGVIRDGGRVEAGPVDADEDGGPAKPSSADTARHLVDAGGWSPPEALLADPEALVGGAGPRRREAPPAACSASTLSRGGEGGSPVAAVLLTIAALLSLQIRRRGGPRPERSAAPWSPAPARLPPSPAGS